MRRRKILIVGMVVDMVQARLASLKCEWVGEPDGGDYRVIQKEC